MNEQPHDPEDIFNLVKKTKQTQVLAKHEQKQNVTELVHSWITVFYTSKCLAGV